MTIRYEDLSPDERWAVDNAPMPPDRLLGLINRFNIAPVNIAALTFALKADEVPQVIWEEASLAGDAHAAMHAALEEFRKLPPEGRFITDERGGLVYDMHGKLPAGAGPVIERSVMIEMLSALDFATVDQFIRHSDVADELEADVARASNRLNVDRRRLWLALLRFWRGDLGNGFEMNLAPSKGNEPYAPVIDFIMAASVNAVHKSQRTPQAVRNFIRRAREKGLI